MNAQTGSPLNTYTVPAVSIKTAHTGATNKANALGMRTMQERAYARRGEQYLLIKSPPASGKSRALMFIALDKLNNQGLQQAIVAQDLVMKLRPTVLISQDTGLVVDHFEYSPVPGIDPHVNVVFLDWSELTPQDGNPTQMIA